MLVTAFERIADDPMHAPSCDHIRRGYRRAIAESHVIYFHVTDMGIDVIRVLHERMDAPARVKVVVASIMQPTAEYRC
jgi:toxin ParE1/3/4